MTTERERVERVASEVLGWARGDTLAFGFVGYAVPPKGDAVIRSAPGDQLLPWNPFASASDDYMVLEHVRQTWGAVSIQQFANELRKLAYARWKANPEGPVEASFAVVQLRYLFIGDYANCALEVLDSHQSRIQESDG